ncbi:type VII secretion protein EccB [Antrihabitans sp. YC3-6]|uniref:Type VII secretion protein EccB n=1 Tax=Antrihabitans stalagmiti TaxID=2799499 RepID=A0A934U1J8_9NOCA|nr:type VII secretion protein EccB [Antrihabitans stalagmiti]MBJ8338579.1 type VII secretion protein EccB [Antrihabitans stalagmiti]
MASQLTTKAQVNGYRFLLRRLEHALVRRDVRMLHDPMRSQMRSLSVGLVLGILGLAGCAILAFLRPQGSIGDAEIVYGKDSGALYVVTGKQIHPVLNLASARLITSSSEKPTSVKDSKINTLPRGMTIGIPGAPQALPGSNSGAMSTWTVCETVKLSESGSAAKSSGVTTTVFSTDPVLGEGSRALDDKEALLARRGDKTYLLYGGNRAEIDTANTSIARTLELSGMVPRPIGTGLLNSTVEVPPITAPKIPDAGQPTQFRFSGAQIGSVIKVSGLDETDLYVVLKDGIQKISPFTASVIRNSDSQGMTDVVAVTPDAINGVAQVNSLPVDHFPREIPTVVTAESDPVGCVAWSRSTDDPEAKLTMLAGRKEPLSKSMTPLEMVTSDGTGDRIDYTYIPQNSGEFVQVTGIEPDSTRRESVFYVADTGVRYGIGSPEDAKTLGLGDKPLLAPYPIVSLLVPGPTLSKSNALVGHDGVTPDPFGVDVTIEEIGTK